MTRKVPNGTCIERRVTWTEKAFSLDANTNAARGNSWELNFWLCEELGCGENLDPCQGNSDDIARGSLDEVLQAAEVGVVEQDLRVITYSKGAPFK